MFKKVFFSILVFLAAVPANSENTRISYFVNCTSTELNLTFEINTLFRTVRNVNYNTKMDVLHWSKEAINTKFTNEKSLSQFVKGINETDNVSVNFDRLKGSVSVGGINAPTEMQIKQCQQERNWGCHDWIVTEIFYARCSIIEQKF